MTFRFKKYSITNHLHNKIRKFYSYMDDGPIYLLPREDLPVPPVKWVYSSPDLCKVCGVPHRFNTNNICKSCKNAGEVDPSPKKW